MDGTGDHDVKYNEPVSQGQALCIFSHMWNLGGKEEMWRWKRGEEEKHNKRVIERTSMIKVYYIHISKCHHTYC
jgi:hypothetical protein